ncbi:BatA domain-containing protein [Aquisphaera insulae]|uniref:BatA domain-containing protein n=1 Tax=Aquisphaera insulae TaxID=2712864 RepID=UPI0013E9C607|nr:BatA domain-containing protein [Aquisphaera insulae]
MLSLLSPLLVWGTLLGAIPIIIHLLNRRRFRVVEWAPMRHLKLTIRRNRRRIQIEELLLLLLRIALPVLLFLFLARPVLNPTGLETWLIGGGRTSQIVLVDDSLSMGYAGGGPPAFHRAREAAGAVLGAANPQDRCTLVAASAPRTPVFLEVEGTRREELSGDALALPLSDTHAAWPTVLAGVDEVVQSCTYPMRNLTIVTDLRKSGWDASVGEVARRWQEQGVRVRVVDVGGDQADNVALQALIPLDRAILAGAETHWEATVRNDSPRVLSRAKAILRIDDRPTEVPLPEIPPHHVMRVPITARFPSQGMHDISLQLPEDELAGDNQIWAAVPVKDSLLIRLVDGEPSSEPFGSEVDYLAAPLSIGVGDAEAWRIETVQEENFLNPRLEPADVLVLANVSSPTEEQARKLAQLVRGGMGLMVFTGGRLDTALYNQRLYRSGEPLLPVCLKAQADEAIRGLTVEDVRPSPIERLLELRPSALERVSVRRIMGVEEPSGEPGAVRVLARWNDPARSPAVVERVVGEGRVLLWTTTADRADTDWPIEPSFVLAIREAVRGTARPTSFAHTVTAGERPTRIVHSSHQLTSVRLTPPGGGEPRSLTSGSAEDRASGDATPAWEITVPDTRRAGLYRVSWDEGPLGTQQDVFASNPDARESELDRIAAADLKGLLAPLKVEVAAARGDGRDAFSATGREVWHEMAWVLLALLIFEPILAAWVGRSR